LTAHRVELRWSIRAPIAKGPVAAAEQPSTRVWTGIKRAKLVAFGEIARLEFPWTL